MMSRVAVVGSGPNGLAAAVTLARAGLNVDVYERNSWLGGGLATRELTLPGFRHDVASTVHPMVFISPFFQEFGLVNWVEMAVPEASFAHPLPDGRSAIAYRDLDRAADTLGADGRAYRRLMKPLVDRIDDLGEALLNPLLRKPENLTALALFTARLLEQGSGTWNVRFSEEMAPALLTGAATHAIGRHPRPAMAASGLFLTAAAHAGGWPLPVGGSQAIADAMIDDITAHGGRFFAGTDITDLGQLGAYDATILDVSAQALLDLAGERLPASYRRALRTFRPGPGVSKVDFALDGPVPWSDPRLADVPTLHLGGTRAQIAEAEAAVMRGKIPENPYVLAVQASTVDPTRAPDGKVTFWAYTHVPLGSNFDATEAITRTVEAHAPGFRDRILASHATRAIDFADSVSSNFAGGDFATGAVSMWQMLKRPVVRPTPWRTPLPGVYLASSATAPGPAAHGMCGALAARTLLSDSHNF